MHELVRTKLKQPSEYTVDGDGVRKPPVCRFCIRCPQCHACTRLECTCEPEQRCSCMPR